MGLPMAGHLQRAGHPLYVHTRTKHKAEPLTDTGAKWCPSPAAAVAKAQVVFICVTDTPDVEAVILGDKGILSAAKPGLIVVDHSTISPSATKQMSQMLATRGAMLLDAPVSGGDIGAKNATLSIMVGGDEQAFARAEPLLRCMGKTITHCGPSGAGQLTKLVNQILVSVNCLAASEAMSFAKKCGLDPQNVLEVVLAGAGGSWQLERLGPKMLAGDMKPGFSVDLQQKDLRLVLQAAEEAQSSLPATSLAHQLYTAAQAAGHGKDGTQSLFTVLEKLASLH
jgi:3-hydroxyisobutyrate dehydrogenase